MIDHYAYLYTSSYGDDAFTYAVGLSDDDVFWIKPDFRTTDGDEKIQRREEAIAAGIPIEDVAAWMNYKYQGMNLGVLHHNCAYWLYKIFMTAKVRCEFNIVDLSEDHAKRNLVNTFDAAYKTHDFSVQPTVYAKQMLSHFEWYKA